MGVRVSIRDLKCPVNLRFPWLLIILGLLAMLTSHRACAQSIRTSRDVNPKIAMGRFPPDFTLPRLRFETNDQGKPVGVIDEADTIRLSSFRGKRPVCLIMSSYT